MKEKENLNQSLSEEKESKEEPVFLQKCPICGRIFKTKILTQDFCDDCIGDLCKDCLS